MRFLIIHLSDAHFAEEAQIDSGKIKSMVDLIKIIEKEKRIVLSNILICFSGDIAYAGLNYDLALNFIIKLEELIIDNYPEIKLNFYITAGNHDLDQDKTGKRSRESIKKLFVDKGTDEMYELLKEETTYLEEFYDFSSLFYCHSEDDSRILDQKELTIKGADKDTKIIINIINSAPFSTLTSFSETNDDDKGIHYFPEKKLGKIRENRGDLIITMMHHPPTWFSENNRYYLEDAITNNSTILLLGHEHYGDAYKNELLISRGGMFSNKGEYKKSEFNIIDISMINKEALLYNCNWNNYDNKYNRKLQNKHKFGEKNYLDSSLNLNKEFYKELNMGNGLLKNYETNEFFVFPSLSRIKVDAKEMGNERIRNFTEFKKQLETNNNILIVGKEKSGRTTLSKYFFSMYNDAEHIPVLLELEDLKNDEKKIIKRAIKRQYADGDNIWSTFNSLSENKKIAIVDDFDLIKEKKRIRILNELKKSFSFIILFKNQSYDFNIKEKIELHGLDDFIEYRIDDYYFKQRLKLTDKLYNTVKLLETIPKNEYDDFFVEIYKQPFYVDKNPYTIILYAYFLSTDTTNTVKAKSSTFNKVFSHNLESRIIDAIDEMPSNIDLDIYSMFLEEMAFEAFNSERYYLKISDINGIIKQYNDNYYYNKVETTDLIHNMIKYSFIIKNQIIDGEYVYCFQDNNEFAYFVASFLTKENNINLIGRSEYNRILKNLIEEISFGINKEIILFLSFLKGDSSLLEAMLDFCNKELEEWEELDIINSKVLNSVSLGLAGEEIKIPDGKDREIHVELVTDIERETSVSDDLSLDLFDYKKNYNYKDHIVVLCFTIINLLSTALPSFINTLLRDVELRNKIFEAIYIIPNKILKKIIDEVDFEYFYNEFLAKEDISGIDNKKEFYPKLFKVIMIAEILAIYFETIGRASHKSTIKYISEKAVSTSKTHEYQTLIGYYTCKDYSSFADSVEQILSDRNNENIYELVLILVHIILVENTNIPLRIQDKLIRRLSDHTKISKEKILIDQKEYSDLNLK